MDFSDKYKNKQVDLHDAVNEFFVDNGVCHFYCKVESKQDIINKYSVEGYEITNPEFTDYLLQLTDFVPNGMPVVLEITGCKFSEKEQKHIEDAIWNYFELLLAKSQNIKKKFQIRTVWNTVFLLGCIGIAALNNYDYIGVISEIFYIMFWFFGDSIIEYFAFDRKETNAQRIRYAQLQSMKIYFSDSFVDREFSDDEVDSFCNEIEEHIDSTEL